ncbi:MAG TPA: four-carbon acid sugar kinase family protein [Terriglobia bacterium]|nr:four-carbon acid sugar kinase family protein [Terriglobia bacterium]
MQQVLVLADDLTGALEVGAKFAARCLPVRVATRPSVPAGNHQRESVLVIDTETRHVSPEEAGSCVLELSCAGRDAGFRFVYKKTDSTLRGNITSEISALAEAFPNSPVLYVPAYPKMGRTVRAGVLYVEGIPVAETSFATDELNPVRESHIPSLLSEMCNKPVFSATVAELGTSPEAGIYVCDCETDRDLEAAAESFVRLTCPFHIAAGPAGFADALARFIAPRQTAPVRLPKLRRVLIVNGSRSEVSIRQIQYARAHNFAAASGDEIVVSGDASGWVILDESGSDAGPMDFARRVARTVRGVLGQIEFEGLVVFGGDTAYAIVESLGKPDLHPIAEALEGVPVSAVCRKAAGLKGDGFFYLISKAGGFGAVDVLCQMNTKLKIG